MTELPLPRLWRLLVWALCALAGLAGLLLGYDVGARVAGVLLGVVMALNAAAFVWLMASAVLDRLIRWLRSRALQRNANADPA
jgi:hypothetical protein